MAFTRFYHFFFLLTALYSHAQKPTNTNISINGVSTFVLDSNNKICIKEITVNGVKKTKKYLVFREMQFKQGDSLVITEIVHELEQARQQIYNTTLFEEVKLKLAMISATDASITVNVKERWYIYLLPQFYLADRNFNEWYRTYKASLSRISYGLNFSHNNFTGRKDQLLIYLINGYTRGISLYYFNPYCGTALDRGVLLGAKYSQSKEVGYKTDSANKLLRYAKKYFVKKDIIINGGYMLREGLFKRHIFSIGYTYTHVDDSVLKHNPVYFNGTHSSKRYIDISYLFQYTRLNNNLYPLKGQSAYVLLLKRLDAGSFSGGANMFTIEGGFNKYIDLKKKWYTSFHAMVKLKLPFHLAYINQRAFGYDETYLRGLEYYVIDGAAAVLFQSTLKKKIFSFNMPSLFKSRTISKIPFTLFVKGFADAGYVYNRKEYDTYLNNRFLYSGGFGIDILTLYDISIRFEYSFNQLKQNGLFLHSKTKF